MSKSRSDLDELKSLQREAADLQGKREATRPSDEGGSRPDSAMVEEREVTTAAALGSAERGPQPDWEKTLQELGAHVESAVKDMEEIAQKRPALALLAALTTGIAIGLVLSRR